MYFYSNNRKKLKIEYEENQNELTFDIFSTNYNFEHVMNNSKIKLNLIYTQKLKKIHQTNEEKIKKIEKEFFNNTVIDPNLTDKNLNSILSPFFNLEEITEFEKLNTKLFSDLKLILKMRNENKSKIYIDKIIDHLEKTKSTSFSLYKYQILIFLILIQNSKDKEIFESMKNLDKVGFQLRKISEIEVKELQVLISSVKYSQKKSNEIKNLTKELLEKYFENPPETFYDILNLPGIELKTAQIYFNLISETNKKIVVTSHVHRISKRLKWVKSSSYDQTRIQLESVLDFDLRAGLNFVLDVFGQMFCKKENPKCDECLLKDDCGYYKKLIKSKRIRKQE